MSATNRIKQLRDSPLRVFVSVEKMMVPKAPPIQALRAEIYLFLCWRPYWPPSWIVSFGHHCHYDKSIPWPWKYYIRHFICYCSLPLTWYIHIFVCWWPYWTPYWTPSWIVAFRHYCHYDKSIPWPWKYYIRHFICYCSLPLTWYIHIFVFGGHIDRHLG